MTTEAIGFSNDLPTARAMRAIVENVDLAVWRSESGKVSAWDNRCPHRGMRLSHGFVRGESLACMYHGWQFSTAGKCKYIPALPSLEPSEAARPKAYSVIEQNKLLWVSVEGEAIPCTIDVQMEPLRSLTFTCTPAQAHTAFLETPLSPALNVPEVSTKLNSKKNMLTVFSDATNPEITIVFQRQNANAVVAHVMAHQKWSNKQRVELSRWCEHIRRVAERARSQ